MCSEKSFNYLCCQLISCLLLACARWCFLLLSAASCHCFWLILAAILVVLAGACCFLLLLAGACFYVLSACVSCYLAACCSACLCVLLLSYSCCRLLLLASTFQCCKRQPFFGPENIFKSVANKLSRFQIMTKRKVQIWCGRCFVIINLPRFDF